MPIYVHKCGKCDKTTDAIRTFAECDNAPECEHCGGKTNKIITSDIRTTVVGVRKGRYNSTDYS